LKPDLWEEVAFREHKKPGWLDVNLDATAIQRAALKSSIAGAIPVIALASQG
jgi:hypothetical protein